MSRITPPLINGDSIRTFKLKEKQFENRILKMKKMSTPAIKKDKVTEKHVIVTGDVVMDWNLINIGTTIHNQQGTKLCWQRGGAALLADLIDTIIKNLHEQKLGKFVLHQTKASTEQVPPYDELYIHNFMEWSVFKEKNVLTWRVEKNLGYYLPPVKDPNEFKAGKRSLMNPRCRI